MTLNQINFREPKVIVRTVLGILLVANLVAAAMAFHLIGDTPADLEAQLNSARISFRAAQQRLIRSKAVTRNMDLSREQGDKFLVSYMTTRRRTYSTIGGEINQLAKTAGMKVGDFNYALPDPIEGSDDLSMLSLTAGFEGGYAQLVKFVNQLDRSPRFLLIEAIQVTPQPKGDLLNAMVRLNTFIRDESPVEKEAVK